MEAKKTKKGRFGGLRFRSSKKSSGKAKNEVSRIFVLLLDDGTYINWCSFQRRDCECHRGVHRSRGVIGCMHTTAVFFIFLSSVRGCVCFIYLVSLLIARHAATFPFDRYVAKRDVRQGSCYRKLKKNKFVPRLSIRWLSLDLFVFRCTGARGGCLCRCAICRSWWGGCCCRRRDGRFRLRA